MTATELRETAKEIPEIVGAHGMNKPELVSAIKKARGIEDPAGAKDATLVRGLKKQMKELKAKQAAAISAEDDKMAAIFRKRVIRLKKKIRRAA